MKGKETFTSSEAGIIRGLIEQKQLADAAGQKHIRAAIRRLGFYISDFSRKKGYTIQDFDRHVVIVG